MVEFTLSAIVWIFVIAIWVAVIAMIVVPVLGLIVHWVDRREQDAEAKRKIAERPRLRPNFPGEAR